LNNGLFYGYIIVLFLKHKHAGDKKMKRKTGYLWLIAFCCLTFFGCSSLPVKKTETLSFAAGLTDAWDFGGYKIMYHKSGKGEPMIFLHNGGTDHRIWDFQVKHFASTHTIYALDILGFGESDKPRTSYSLDLYTKMVEGFVEDLNLSSVTLVGNCIGSSTALSYASQHPEKVKRLILFNILTEDTLREGAYGYWRTMSRIPGGKGCLGFLAPFVWVPDFYITGEMGKLYGPNGLKGEPDSEFIDHLRMLFKKPEQMINLTSVLVNIKSYQAIAIPPKGIELPPICVFWGEQNRVLPAESSIGLCASYHFKEFHVIKDTGHFLMREEYEKINAIMAKFIESPSSARP